MRKYEIASGTVCVVLLLVIMMEMARQKEIVVDTVNGSGKGPNEYYFIYAQTGMSEIPCTLEQHKEVTVDSRQYAHAVVYKQNKWFRSDKRILKLTRFERPFPTDQNERVQTTYYRLAEETMEPLNDKTSVFTRLYEKGVSCNNLFDVIPESVILPGIKDIREARFWLKEHKPEFLQLKDRTIVEPAVLDSWIKRRIPTTIPFSFFRRTYFGRDH